MLMLKDLDQAFKKKDTVLIREIIERDENKSMTYIVRSLTQRILLITIHLSLHKLI